VKRTQGGRQSLPIYRKDVLGVDGGNGISRVGRKGQEESGGGKWERGRKG
jgi:hypothetical protein